jgi:hypothetical protein
MAGLSIYLAINIEKTEKFHLKNLMKNDLDIVPKVSFTATITPLSFASRNKLAVMKKSLIT